MIAFWKYDLYPFVCSGTVSELKNEGRVGIKEYGGGFSFKPIHIIVDDEEGLLVKQKLSELEKEYDNEKKKLLELYMNKSYEIAPFLKNNKKII